MRVLLAAAMAVTGLMLASSGALAKEGDKEIEATLNYGTESFDGVGGQFGATAGFGYQFRDNLEGRADLSYFRSGTMQGEVDVTGTRVPIDLGVRYYCPLGNLDRNLTVYGQGGLEVSFDDWKPAAGLGNRSDTRLGAVLGAGAEYALDPHYGAILNLQYHIVEGGYLSAGIGMAYHF